VGAARDWWRTFFSGPVVDFWLNATTEEQTKQEADFIEKVLQVSPPAKLLDVPSGGGRHSVELATRDYLLTGVDISSGFLSAAHMRASSKRRFDVRWERRDMRDLPRSDEFDAVFSFGNSFGYYEEEGMPTF
jgi:cyclopropane fatty-acyl-phospholipid synthase-like methyltransferase